MGISKSQAPKKIVLTKTLGYFSEGFLSEFSDAFI